MENHASSTEVASQFLRCESWLDVRKTIDFVGEQIEEDVQKLLGVQKKPIDFIIRMDSKQIEKTLKAANLVLWKREYVVRAIEYIRFSRKSQLVCAQMAVHPNLSDMMSNLRDSGQRIQLVQTYEKVFSKALDSKITPPIQIKVKTQLLEKAIEFSNRLLDGSFKRNTTHTVSIVGGRGIGKTEGLKNICRLLGAFFPSSLIPIYLDCSDASISLAKALQVAAIQRNICIPGDLKADELLVQIAEHNYKILFLIDELDVVYQRKCEDSLVFLNDINAMCQSNEHGACAIIACGSAAALPLLISKNKGMDHPNIVAKYPVLADAPDLNDTKFPPLALHAKPLTQKECKEAILAINPLMDPSLCDLELCNVVRFFAGCNLRFIDRVLRISEAEKQYGTLRPPTPEAPALRDLYNKILNALVAKNSELLDSIASPGVAIDLKKVQTLETDKCILPLVNSDLMTLLQNHTVDQLILLAGQQAFYLAQDLSELAPITPYHIAYHAHWLAYNPSKEVMWEAFEGPVGILDEFWKFIATRCRAI